MASYTPGNEPNDIKRLLDAFLTDVDNKFPDGTIVWSEWNHEKWDKPAGFLCKKLGYSRGAEFLKAYGYEIVMEREPEPELKSEPYYEENPYEARSKQESSTGRAKKPRQSEERYVPRPKKKNRPLLIISCVVLIIALLGVGGAFFYMNRSETGLSFDAKSEPGPDRMISQFCDAMKAFDLDKMHSYVISSNQNWGVTDDNDMAVAFVDSMKDWAKKMTYTVGNKTVDGDKASVTVNFKYTDATNVVKSTLGEYLTQAFSMVFDNPSEEQLTQLLTQIYKEQSEKIPTTAAETAVIFPCTKISEEWKIDALPDEALNVLTSNILKVFDEFNENIETNGTSAVSQPISEANNASKKVFKVGEKAETETIAMTLTGIRDYSGDSFMKPADGNTFIVCDFEVENKNTKNLEISTFNFSGYCDNYSVETELTYSDAIKVLSTSLAPGKMIIGSVVFEGPQDWKEIEIHFKEDVIVYAFQDNVDEDLVFMGINQS